MLYLEDYLEMIENLPMEMRERLTEMREMDLQVQNALDNLDDRVKVFFKRCIQPNQKTDWKDEQFQSLKQDYFKVLDDADEKVHLANHIYDLVDRHLRKLDQELAKFKMELEADNAGITEVLEKRSLELDVPPPAMNNHRPDKRRIISSSPALTSHTEKQITTERVLSSLATEVAKETIGQRRASAVTNPTPINVFNSGNNSQAGVTYSLGQMGAGSNAAIAAAASQAIAATQQTITSSRSFVPKNAMQQGRRTPSMKASYVAMGRHADLAKELTFGKEIAYSTQPVSTPPPNAEITTQRTQRTKKQSKAAAASSAASAVTQQPQAASVQQAQATPQPAVPQASPQAEEYPTELQIVDENGQPVDWQDPNEPRYCLCNNVSYGDMVGCDNDDCPIEWFHYGCVGLTQAPKGKWYCPQCTMAMKRRGRR